MKTIITALTLAMLAPAESQSLLWTPVQWPLPETVPWSVKGVPVGTATMGSDNRMYLRWFGGTFAATAVFHSDGTRTIYDPSGKIIEWVPLQ
jgi:hypothetical protein